LLQDLGVLTAFPARLRFYYRKSNARLHIVDICSHNVQGRGRNAYRKRPLNCLTNIDLDSTGHGTGVTRYVSNVCLAISAPTIQHPRSQKDYGKSYLPFNQSTVCQPLTILGRVHIRSRRRHHAHIPQPTRVISSLECDRVWYGRFDSCVAYIAQLWSGNTSWRYRSAGYDCVGQYCYLVDP
jgi:hypothetical protein